MLKQILLITDGCSNTGISPVITAAEAYEEGITVNVVGITSQDTLGAKGRQEIEEIARAGGGMSRIVRADQLSQTVQMMTRRTITHTIHQIVNQELKQIMQGEPDQNRNQSRDFQLDRNEKALEELSPQKRAQVVRVVDQLSEESSLQVALLVDTSSSMRPKLPAVQEAVEDLMLSLQARSGKSEVAAFHFPGKKLDIALDCNWTSDTTQVKKLFSKLTMSGVTPTGPAISSVVQFFMKGRLNMSRKGYINDEPSFVEVQKDGMLGDYIV